MNSSFSARLLKACEGKASIWLCCWSHQIKHMADTAEAFTQVLYRIMCLCGLQRQTLHLSYLARTGQHHSTVAKLSPSYPVQALCCCSKDKPRKLLWPCCRCSPVALCIHFLSFVFPEASGWCFF